MTTSEIMSKRMSLPCQCGPKTVHVPCKGALTKKSAFYTPEMAQRVCKVILQGEMKQTVEKILWGKHMEGEIFGKGGFCVCHDFHVHETNLTCGHCRESIGDVLAADGDWGPCGLGKEETNRKLYLLHASTGHGPLRFLVQALERKGVHPEILKAAREFRCVVCEERSRPQPRNLAALEPQPPKFDTLTADVGHFNHPISGEHYQFLLMVDEVSRFKVARIILHGKKKHISAGQFLSVLKEAWISYFGRPRTLRVDPDGAFRSHELSEYCDRNHIYLDIIPGEAHWKLGVCEKGLQSVKELLLKVFLEIPDSTPEDALAECVRALNCREVVRGYSPVQHVLGRAPDDAGRFFTPSQTPSPDLMVESPASEHKRSETLRLAAEKATIESSIEFKTPPSTEFFSR